MPHAHPTNKTRLSLSLEGLGVGESSHVVLDRALVAQELDVGTVGSEMTSSTLLDVLSTVERSETPFLGNDDLLATRELVLAAAKSLDGGSTV